MGYPAFPSPPEVPPQGGGGGSGGVSSVGLSLPSQFQVTGSPVTAAGTLTGTWNNESANLIFAGPASGAAAAPTFRAMVAADLPLPTTSSIGGVEAINSVAHQWINSISTSGVPSLSQPAFGDISGLLLSAQVSWPLLAPDGSVSAPSYSWVNEASTGFYRATSHDMRATVNGKDVFRLLPFVVDAGGGAVTPTNNLTFFGNNVSGTAATGITLSVNRIFIGTEALQGIQFPQSPQSWAASSYLAPTQLGSINVTSQIGGMPIVASSRSSDWLATTGASTGGTGSYFLAVNDDTSTPTAQGWPIASALNATGWRALNCKGITESVQVDVENLGGTTVDVTPFSGFPNGTTIGINLTNGAFSTSAGKGSVGIVFGPNGGGTNSLWRRGIVFQTGTLDTSLGAGGAGIAMEIPRNVTMRWINSGGGVDAEITGNASGFVVAQLITAQAGLAVTSNVSASGSILGGSIGIQGGSGNGGTVTQTGSITTAVTLNKITGTITTVSNTFTAGGIVQFTVNNSLVGANDTVIPTPQTANVIAFVNSVQAGSFVIGLDPLVSATSAVAINFMVFKGTIT